MDLELIGFDLCPYVHRARITVLYKNIACKVTHIDKSKPPDWFRPIAASGKVPLLRINDNTVIFESAVINEFLDEISGGGLMPADPISRALSRSWIEYGSGLMGDLKGLLQAKNAQHFEAAIIGLRAKYMWLEKTLGDGPYFNGANVSLVDFAYAPFFVRTHHLGADALLYQDNPFPRLMKWAGALRDIPAVGASLDDDFREQLHASVRETGRYTAKQLNL